MNFVIFQRTRVWNWGNTGLKCGGYRVSLRNIIEQFSCWKTLLVVVIYLWTFAWFRVKKFNLLSCTIGVKWKNWKKQQPIAPGNQLLCLHHFAIPLSKFLKSCLLYIFWDYLTQKSFDPFILECNLKEFSKNSQKSLLLLL